MQNDVITAWLIQNEKTSIAKRIRYAGKMQFSSFVDQEVS